jgi:1-aminocyclopropane-1-carboxylate deaminase/D-cysteine desulfhydrase-like pyridoxal-dependent ACC family enzyme
VYTGKAMAGLVAAAREGRLPADGRIVFLHTGGLPALFAHRYAHWVRAGAPG